MSVMSQRETWLRHAARSRALRYLPVTAITLDFLVILGSLAVGTSGRDRWVLFGTPADLTTTAWLASPAIAATWLLAIWSAGGYRRASIDAGTDELRSVARAGFWTVGVVGIGCYFLDFPLSRGFFFLTFAVGMPLLLAGRWGLRRLVYSIREFGLLQHNVLVVGGLRGIEEVSRVLSRETKLGYRVIGCLTPDAERETRTRHGVPVLGRCEEVIWQVLSSDVDVVFFVDGGLASSEQMRRIAWDLETHDVHVVVAPSISEVAGDRVRIRPVGGLPLIHVDPPRAHEAARWGKRGLDIVGLAHAAHRGGTDPAIRRGTDQAARRRTGAVPSGPRRSRRRGVQSRQAAHHGRRRRDPAAAAPRRERLCRWAVQARPRSTDHRAWHMAATAVAR